MPSLGLGLGVNRGRSTASVSLNFSALTALPASRRGSLMLAANTVATALSVTPQSVIDAAGRCLEWWDWRSNTFTDAGATTPAVQGNAIHTFRGVKAGLLAAQSDAALKPTLGVGGIVITQDQMIAPSTGFPSGDTALGCVSVLDFSGTQSTGFPIPFAFGDGTTNTRMIAYYTNSGARDYRFSVGVGNSPITTSNILGQNSLSFLSFYTPGTKVFTTRHLLNAEANTTVGAATGSFSGSSGFVYLGGYGDNAVFFSTCTIRQVLYTTSLADARVLYLFLRALEGL
jgi:hypothetical protein